MWLAWFGWQVGWFDAVEADGALAMHDDGHGVVWVFGSWPKAVSGFVDPGECTVDAAGQGVALSLVSGGESWTGHVRRP